MINKSTDKIHEIVEAITDRKGKKIALMDLNKIETAPADSFVVCQGSSISQVASIADSIRERLQKNMDIKPYNYDGYKNSQWIIIDYGDVMVHVFLPEFREFYNLEELWNDANITNLPDLD